jgi:DNA-binding PadR family transcriptional regulator
MNEPESLLPLSPAVFHILLVLADGELHGYGIMGEIKRISGGALNVGAGTLYRSINQMLEHNLITEVGDKVDPKLNDERRRYYRLTERGRHVAQAEAERLAALVQVAQARRLIGGAL